MPLTIVVFGVVALSAVEESRFRRRPPAGDDETAAPIHLSRAWAALGVLGVAVAAVLGTGSGNGELATWSAAGTAALAVAAARGAGPFQAGWLREASGVVGLASATMFAFAADVADPALGIGVVGVSVAATAVALSVWRRRPESAWLRPMFVLGLAANIEAAVLALSALPSRTLLVAVLASIGVQALSAGIAMDRPRLLAAGPPALGAAFILVIAGNVGGSPQRTTIPIGIVVLAVLEILRQIDRSVGRERNKLEPLVAEWIGIGLLAAPPLVEMFTSGILYGLAAYGTAVVLLLWAVATRIRHRAIAAGSLAVAASVLALFVAAAGSAPDSAVFWIVAVGVGFAVMLVAALIEAYRSKKGRVMARFDEMMEGWQ